MAAREQEAGKGIDHAGGPVIDPTKNVLDLVKAESLRQDGLREAETRRINELAALRVYYEAIIEGMRSNSLKLLAEQLRENKADSSERIAKLEQFRWETGGRGTGVNSVVAFLGVAAGLAIALAVAIFK